MLKKNQVGLLRSVYVCMYVCMLLSTTNVYAQLEYPPDYNDWQNDPALFTENKGQLIDELGNVKNNIKFYTRDFQPNVYLMENAEMSFVQLNHASDTIDPDTLSRIDFRLTGDLSEDMIMSNQGKSTDYRNYYLPHSPSDATFCHAYQKITYEEVYPNIDLEIRGSNHYPKFYFVVKPGGSPNDIQFQFTGQDSVNVDPYLLELYYGLGELELPNAIAYEEQNGNITPLNWIPIFQNQGNGKVNFGTGTYNTNNNLIIQVGPPEDIIYAYYGDNNEWTTYYGGSNHDWFNDVVTDNNYNSNIYVTGQTKSTNYPSLTGTVISSSGSYDMLVQKFNADAELLWVTVFGGSLDDRGYGIDITQNEVYAVGNSSSDNVPILLPQPPSFRDGSNAIIYNPGNTTDGLILKLDNTTGTHIFSTYIGFDNRQTECHDIEIADNNHIYIVGLGKIQSAGQNLGNGKGFVIELDANFVPVWRTQIGSNNDDSRVTAIATTANNEFYIVGTVNSTFLTLNQQTQVPTGYTKPGGITQGGLNDIFIAKFNNATNHQISWCTFYGGSSIDGVDDVIIDDNGDIFISGTTLSSDLPTYKQVGTNPIYYANNLGGLDALLMKFSDVGERLWVTYYGGAGNDKGFKLSKAHYNLIYMTGYTQSLDFPLAFSTTQDFYYNDMLNALPNFFGNSDAFLVGFDENTLKVKTSTYFGGHNGLPNNGTSWDYGYSITADAQSRLLLVGRTQSSVFFPTRDFDPNSIIDYYDNSFNGGTNGFDGFISRLRPPIGTISTIEVDNQGDFKVFPNPSNGVFIIATDKLLTNESMVQVFNLQGQLLKTQRISNGLTEIDLNNYSKGSYLLRINTKEGVETKIIQIH